MKLRSMLWILMKKNKKEKTKASTKDNNLMNLPHARQESDDEQEELPKDTNGAQTENNNTSTPLINNDQQANNEEDIGEGASTRIEPDTGWLKDHPKKLVIDDPTSGVRTRYATTKEDPFACYLSPI